MASLISTLSQKLSVGKSLLFCRELFTKPTFVTFIGVVKSMLKNRDNGKLSVLSLDVGKCISSISYFFNEAKWNANTLKMLVQQHLLNSKQTKICEGDLASIDESAISKKGDTFQFIGDVWDNADKCVNSGYEYLAIAIISPLKKTKWLFDYLFYSNQDPKFRSKPLYVHRILKRLFKLAKQIQTIVLDSGFKNKYTVKMILNAGKNLIIRADADMKLWLYGDANKAGCSFKFGEIKKMPNAKHYDLEINGRKGWSITWATGIVNAWMSEVKKPLTVIVVKHPTFRKPMILVTNIIPNNFVEAFEVYEKYLQRWKIEQIFQSIKELGLEKFRVRKLKAIMRYLTIIFVVHSLLVWKTAYLKSKIALKKLIENMLKKKRKIKELLCGGMKIFYELYLQKNITLNEFIT